MAVLVAPAEVVESPGISPETISPVSMPEAIRLGAMATEQSFTDLWEFEANDTLDEVWNGKACAIGAGLIGLGVQPVPASLTTELMYEIFEHSAAKKFPEHDANTNRWLECHQWEHTCPVCLTHLNNWANLTYHLNDDHELPREWIADYLESIGA